MRTRATVQFDGEKFKELLLYFSKRALDEKMVIGATKLNKLLFFTDFTAFAETGRPVTGARYFRLKWGPAARALLPLRQELLDEGRALFKPPSEEEWDAVLVPLTAPDLSGFSPGELAIADRIFEELRPFNAGEASDYSHLRSAGWKVVADREDIPYESVFVNTDPPPAEAIELGRKLAAKYGW